MTDRQWIKIKAPGVMTLKTFKKNLGRYGADFARWPGKAHAAAAKKVLTDKAEAAAIYQEALVLEEALAVYEPPAMPGRLAASVVASVREAERPKVKAGGKSSRGKAAEAFGPRESFWNRIWGRPGVPLGAALVSALLFLVVMPWLTAEKLETTQLSLPVHVTAVEPFLAEWEAMNLAAQEELAQVEDLFGKLTILPPGSGAETEAETVEAFLLELDGLQVPEQQDEAGDLWRAFAGNDNG